ncbi:ubiquitin carboxyl-terminal hydrolase 31 isoform X2 [Ceratitis capitata]|uniref:ubiquitin carboxyl-terminal hydrolase 31 isoform X2 n=1 Tax=Ceratitis capitata TaxID=7213 RepID=UPI0003297257|nr:ubiquitin carboxyl-terminal hydrolase 31 isoform X2 [Ceratitis capitata]
MGTKEQTSGEVNVKPASGTATANHTNVNTTNDTLQQQQQHQHVQLPKASAAPQVIIVPAAPTTTAAATNTAKKIRRAFSMPRNPFRWSRKFKTSNSTTDNVSTAGGSNSAISSCVGGGRGRAGSIVSLSSYEAVCKDTNGVGGGGGVNATASGGGGSATNEVSTDGSIKRDNIRKVADHKIVNGKPVSGGNEGNSNNAAANSNRVLRRSSFRKFLNRIAQHVSTSINVGANKSAAAVSLSATADRVPPIGNYQWPADQTPGVMGLKNHGNTCFMNAVLQCLSHTDILAEYFVLDQYKADLKRRNKINSRKFGTKGELTEQLANVLKALWTCKNESDHSTSFKAVVDRYGSQFRSSTQHDAQEFLFWLLDKVHEDLNTATKRRYKSVKNSYGRPDEVIAAETLANHIRCNNSFVQAVFQAQFRSSLTCPRCKKQSNTFDPFHCISVQLPQLMQQTIFVTVVYLKREPRQVKIGLSVPTGSPIVALREQLQADAGIPGKRMVLVDISKEGFTRVFYDSQPVATLCGNETIYCIEVPEIRPVSTTTTATETASLAAGDSEKNTATENTSNKNNAKSNSSTEANARTTEASKNSSSGNTANTTVTSGAKATNAPTTASTPTELILLVANVRKRKIEDAPVETETTEEKETTPPSYTVERFGMPFSLVTVRDCSYADLQKRLIKEMTPLLKPEVMSQTTPYNDLFQMRLQDPSADPDTYLQNVEHPLLTEMIDLALSVLSTEAGPPHIKLLLEWTEPETHFLDLSDNVVEDESVARLLDVGKAKTGKDTAALTLEQCLEHYTKAETLSAEDAWRCPHCQQYLPVVKTLGLWSLPDILVVHFKRFRQHHEKGANAAKLTTMVKFPLNAFDMSPHLARGGEEETGPRASLTAAAAMDMGQHARPSPWKKTRSADSRSSTLSSRDNRETRYDLYAVCYHQGDTLETGHYTAACKNPYDRQWYKFDDQRVSKVSNESIEEEIINNEAYMLFYQRRSGDAAEYSGSSSNSGDHWVSRIAPPPVTAVEKVNASKEKLIEEEIIEERKSVAIAANAATIEPILSKPEATSSDVPKLKEETNEKEIVVEVQIETPPMVVNTEKISVDIDTLEFVDSESVAVEEDHAALVKIEVSALPAIDTLTPNKKKEDENNSVGDNQIFVMDEDCQIEESQPSANQIPTTAAVAKSQKSLSTVAKTLAVSTSKALTAASTTTTAIAPIVSATNTVLTNGHSIEYSKTPNQTTINTQPIVNGKPKSPQATTTALGTTQTPGGINGSRIRNGSTSSSSSSISSHSSPHSLAVSIHGASTLQNKFNGFTTTSAASSNNYKEVLLSSSLKSNSSSIISAAVAAHTAHEFHLTRHQPWNGSRSSVSALENCTQTNNHQHMHGLNLRHSFSTSSNCKLRECSETLSSMLRNSSNTCSKDTLIFIDQQNHHHHHHNHHSLIEDDDDSFMGSRSLWISPVTPHKLITVSPKN